MPRPKKIITPNSFSNRFASRLRELRVKAGLSQEDVAKVLDLTSATVSSWEACNSQPSLDQCLKLAIIFHLNKTKDLFPDEEYEIQEKRPICPKKKIDMSKYSGRFAARFRELREESGLSQTEIAKALNVTKSAVSSWETGRSEPSLNRFPEIAKLLKLSNVLHLFPDN